MYKNLNCNIIRIVYKYVIIFFCFLSIIFTLTACSLNKDIDISNPELMQNIEELQMKVEILEKDLLYCKTQSDQQNWYDETYNNNRDMHVEVVCENVTQIKIIFNGKEYNNDISGNDDFTGLYTPNHRYDGFIEGAAGTRYLSVKDNYGIWYTFKYSVVE